MILSAKLGVTFDAGSSGVTYALHLNGMANVSGSSTAEVHWVNVPHAKYRYQGGKQNGSDIFHAMIKFYDYWFKDNVS